MPATSCGAHWCGCIAVSGRGGGGGGGGGGGEEEEEEEVVVVVEEEEKERGSIKDLKSPMVRCIAVSGVIRGARQGHEV